jgi:hypothetical protein
MLVVIVQKGLTPLMVAADAGQLSTVSILADRDAKIEAVDPVSLQLNLFVLSSLLTCLFANFRAVLRHYNAVASEKYGRSQRISEVAELNRTVVTRSRTSSSSSCDSR